MSGIKFTHLHVHTQYSILDGIASIESLLQKCIDTGMDSLAITDHGNMYGICQFVEMAEKYNVKPIIGSEFYVAKKSRFDRIDKRRYHQILIAKNEQGYKNLSILSSLSFIDGYYYKPRIDKDILKLYHEGIIATTACMAGFVNQALQQDGEQQAEKEILELYDIFGEDFYLELQRFNNLEQEKYNQFLLKMSKKHNIKIIATNDVHYVNAQEYIAHDILLCIQTASEYKDPNRMRFCANSFYLKSPEEMYAMFEDCSSAIHNTQEIVDKCWMPKLKREVLLPQYTVPKEFNSQYEYLTHLTYLGLKRRFKTITEELEERVRYELETIHNMQFEGYFLIVYDYIQAAKNMDVGVGPGRGSVAGSLVAYCIGITNVNPLDYGLFFERFLNPERVSMPDIDIDFEDNGRDKVVHYVVEKYGKDKVANLVTYSTMAAKVAIKDVARVLGLTFEESNKITKLIPDKVSGSLMHMCQTIPEIKSLYDQKGSVIHQVLENAAVLEGCKRQTGIHACGVIIAPDKLIKYLPIKIDKNTDLLITQYEGSLVEHVGMLKMDFLGLKTITIIKNAVKLIKRHRNIDLDIDSIPLDDDATLSLFGSGNTIGVFQFESEGMRTWLQKLKPDNMEDIIAMNALYRPGPMQFIDDFIKRKHGKEKIVYPHFSLEPILKNTYGVIVYQEQVMQVAQVIAGYTLGSADLLRRAMGKKKPEEMQKQKPIFVEGCMKKSHIPREQAEDIFHMMETFAQYGFNKAHAAAYSIIAFQTAYLKTHYTVEFMVAALINAQVNIESLMPLINDCKRIGIKINGPSVNESSYDFDINDKGEVCYGLAGIKGVGNVAANCIIETREKHGLFKDIFDFVKNVDMRIINKKTLESLALSGALDCLKSGNRRQYMVLYEGKSFIEKLIEYITNMKTQKEKMSESLFGDIYGEDMLSLPKPEMIHCEEYDTRELLALEKEFIGFYLSGHPLEKYKNIIQQYCNCNSTIFNCDIININEEIKNIPYEKAIIAGIIIKVIVKITKNNTPYAVVSLEDCYGEIHFNLFGKTYNDNKQLLHVGDFIICIGEIENKYNDSNKYEFKCKNILKRV